jgi:hypothetical protein
LWLLIATALGVLLRAWPVVSMPSGWQYRFFLHAHSHLQLLGFVFNLLYAGLLATHWRDEAERPLHRGIFWGLQLANFGMLFFFPIQGYAAGSIAFSTLHLALTVWLGVRFFRSAAAGAGAGWLTWAFVFMLLSALGPFALGYFKAQHLEAHPGYSLSIYFYLHFQYNGWFTFACIGLALSWAARHGADVPARVSRRALVLMVASCLPGYSLSALWTHPPVLVYASGFLAAALQLVALAPLRRLALAIWPLVPAGLPRLLWRLAAIAFVLKLALQLASAFPVVADWTYADRNVVIAYLHLVLIGVISFFLLGWIEAAGLVRFGRGSRYALYAFIGLFVAHELWLGLGAVLLRAFGRALPGAVDVMLAIAAGLWLALVAVGATMVWRKK